MRLLVVLRTMPWIPLLAGCLTGTAMTILLTSYVAPDPGTVRFTFLPALAGLAFVPRDPFRTMAQSTPAPAWLTSAGQIVLASPVLALTAWYQIRLAKPQPVYPLTAQLAGACALAVAIALCCDRSRFAELGGGLAAPLSLALVVATWYVPRLRALLVAPPAAARTVTISWYAVAGFALVVSVLALRDRWHRYLRRRRGTPARACAAGRTARC